MDRHSAMSSSSSFRPPPFQPLANLHAPFDPSLSLPPLQYGPAGAGPHPAVQVPLRSSAVPAGYQPTRLSHPRPQHHKMAYPHSDEELAHLQKLSNEFEPEVAGPLVSERQPTSSITTEYANSDPVYQVKTAALPQKYAFYRTCRGDGHCGWRAVAFGYFEALLRLGDKRRFHEEETRLRSMKNLLDAVGFQEHLYEDFAGDTYELLQKLAASLPAMEDSAVLMQSFNDEQLSASIITYLKLLTSAWMQTHQADFQPFLLDQDIRQYCATSIEPHLSEIEHVGMVALVDALVKPVDFAVEISYLDRSPGEEVNMYRIDPVGPNGIPLPNPITIRLLYRPGHYDLLYKLEDLQRTAPPPQPIAAPVYVALASPIDEYTPEAQGYAPHDWRNMIPGMTIINPGSQWLNGSFDCMAKPELPSKRVPPPIYTPMPVVRSVEEAKPVNMPLQSPLPQERTGPFRSSAWELEPEITSPTHTLPLQTAIFRNSHYNTAHFLNPDFEPVQWTPDVDYITTPKMNGGRPKQPH